MDDVPFREIYIHGLIRDGHGQKMSKSKGNVLDPLDFIDGVDVETLVTKRTTGLMQPQMAPAIEKATRRDFPDGIPAYGCDALRFTFAALATTGRDMSFELGRIEGNRNFCNKLWNAARFVLMQTEGHAIHAPDALGMADRWVLSRCHQMIAEVRQHIESYRMDLAAQALYEFIWNEYCDWYLELAKPVLLGEDPDALNATRYTLLQVLEATLRTLHPFMPFITEEIWQRLRGPLGLQGDSIMTQPWPKPPERDDQAESAVAWLKSILLGIRRIRSDLDLAPALRLPVEFQGGSVEDRSHFELFEPVLATLARADSFRWLDDDADTSKCAVALVGELKVLIPLTGLVDVDAELARIGKQLASEEKLLKQSQGKMGNRRFVDNAPADVVEKERERLATHEANVRRFREQMRQLERLAEN
jgi:valyl-tRNA synthetase